MEEAQPPPVVCPAADGDKPQGFPQGKTQTLAPASKGHKSASSRKSGAQLGPRHRAREARQLAGAAETASPRFIIPKKRMDAPVRGEA